LEPAETGAPSLHRLTDKLVYSLDRTHEALGPRRSARELSLLWPVPGGPLPDAAGLALAGKRLVLSCRPIRPGREVYDIVRDASLEDPVLIRRPVASRIGRAG
jgi:hypothetical protein